MKKGIQFFKSPVLFMGAFLLISSSLPANEPSKDILRIGVSPTGVPIIFKTKGKLYGMEVDFAKGLAAHLGRDFKFIELKWKNQINALTENKIDVIMSGMSITQNRRTKIEFSDPYLRVGQMALVRTLNVVKYPLISYLILTREKVGVIKGTTGEELVARKFPYAKLKSFKDFNSAVRALEKKKIEMVIYDSPNVYWMASQPDKTKISPVFILLSEENLAWGIRKEDTHLKDQINNFLEGWRDDGRALETIARWLPGLN